MGDSEALNALSDALFSIVDLFNKYYVYIIITVASIVLIFACFKAFYAVRKYQISELTYRRYFSLGGVFEGEGVTFYEEITNNTPLPLLFCDVESYIYGQLRLEGYSGTRTDDMQYFASRFNLAPYSKVRRSRKITAMKRGVYRLTTSCVYVRNTPYYLESPCEIYVYPKYRALGEYSSPINTSQGDAPTKRRLITDPFSLSGIRDYAPGDAFNMINFKATAKNAGKIKVNEREYSCGRIFTVFIDVTLPDGGLEYEAYCNAVEDGLSFASSLIRKALSDGYKAGFGANCKTDTGERLQFFRPSSYNSTGEEILREMARIRIEESVSFNSLLSECLPLIQDGEVYVLTLRASRDTDSILKSYKRRNNNVVMFKLI